MKSNVVKVAMMLATLMVSFPALAQDTKGSSLGISAGTAAGTAASKIAASRPSDSGANLVLNGEPQTPAEVMAAAQKGIEYAKAKNWFGLSSVCILILVFVLKTAGLFKKIGKRWLYIIVPALGVVAMLLAAFAGGVSWSAAWIVLSSAPCAALFSDLVKRGIMAKEPETPLSPLTEEKKPQ